MVYTLRKHGSIVAQTAKINELIEVAKRTNERIQKNCNHELVVELQYGCAYEGSHNRRICACCGYEEEGSNWSSGSTWKVEEAETILGNTDTRIVVSEDDKSKFYALRNKY